MSDNPATELLNRMMGASPPDSVAEMRDLIDGFANLMNADLPEVGAFHEAVLVREIDGRRVTADVVVPKGSGPHPVLVYLHGGGWVCGSPKTHRKLGYRFAEAGYLVFNVDYRLAPEAKFPAPFDDCVDAIRFAARHAGRYGGDATRLAIGGDSAGGNLAAAAAIALADEATAPQISAVLLIYGVFDFARLGEGGPTEGPLAAAGRKMTDMMVGSYLGRGHADALLADPRVSPIHAAEKLPPCHIVVGSADPLAAQAEALARRLAAAGIEHEHITVPDMPHGYVQMEFFPAARQSIDRMVAFLRKHLDR